MDPLETETARFWENHGEYNDVDPAAIQTEVFELPTTCFAEDEGSLTNSGRWLQWHWPGGTPPGEAKTRHLDHGADPSAPEGALPRRRAAPSPIRSSTCTGPTRIRAIRRPEELAKEINGYGARRRAWIRPIRPRCWSRRQAGRRASRAARRRHHGLRLLDLFRLLQRERQQHGPAGHVAIPDDTGAYPKWAFAWPANRRILYNRASADLAGKAWDPTRKLIEWDGAKWSGYDVPDIAPTAKPRRGRSLHHEPGRRRRACSRGA